MNWQYVPFNKQLSEVVVFGEKFAEVGKTTSIFKNVLAKQARHSRDTVDAK